MKFSDKIKLAFYNLMRRKKTTAQCITMTTIIMLLIFVCAFFITTLSLQLNDNIDNYASKNYITIEDSIYSDNSERDTVLLDAEKQAELKAKFLSVTDINYYKSIYGMPAWPTLNELIVDGTAYQGDGTNSELTWGKIVIKEISVPTFSANMEIEFSKKFPNEKLIKYGRDIQNTNEVLFPEEYLIAYDIMPEQILSAIKVSYVDIFTDAKIVGITNANITMMETDETGNRDKFAEITMYAEDSVKFEHIDYGEIVIDTSLKSKNFELSSGEETKMIPYTLFTYQRIELDGAAQASEIVEYLDDVLGEGYWIRFWNYDRQSKLELIGKLLTFTQDIITVLFGVIGVALVVFLYSVLDYNARQKGSYFGMMRAMGIKNTVPISLIEMAITTFISMVLCLILSVITVFSLSGVVIVFSWFSKYTITVNSGLFVLIFALTFALVAVLNMILAYLSSRQHDKRTITTALRS